MATPNIVPRSDSEGGLGTASKYWASAYIDAIYVGAGFVGRDADNRVDFAVDNNIAFKANGQNRLHVNSGNLYPEANNSLSLGYATREFSDLFLGDGAVINFNDGNVVLTHSSNTLTLADNDILGFGNASDLSIKHTDTAGYIQNTKGHLYINQIADDKDIIFQSDDGSGSYVPYLTLDGSAANMKVDKDMRFNDSVDAEFGTSGDFKIYHDGSNTYLEQINAGTGNIVISNANDDADIIFKSDDGSGGTTDYLTLDGSESMVMLYKATRLPDNISLQIGSSGDLQIHHDATDSFIKNSHGNLLFRNTKQNKDILFQGDDGQASDDTIATYFYLDGSSATHNGSATTALYTNFPDNSRLSFGTSHDFMIYHDGTDTKLSNITGSLQFHQNVDDGDIIFNCDDGSGGVTAYLTLDGSATKVLIHKEVDLSSHLSLLDSAALNFGNANDLQIYHDGNNSYISNIKDNSFLLFQNDDGAGGLATYFVLDGNAATHDGSATTALYTNWPDKSRISLGTSHDIYMYHDGANTWFENNTGDLTFRNSANDKDIIFQSDDGSGGVETYFYLNGGLSTPYTVFPDTSHLAFGNSLDLIIHHDTANSYITANGTGDLIISQETDDKDIIFKSDNGSGGTTTYFFLDGSNGWTTFPDSKKATFGTGNDLRIYHDGTNSKITNHVGNLDIIQTTDDADITFQCDDGSGGHTAYLTLDGGNTRTNVHKDLRFDDNIGTIFGSGAALKLHSDGSNGLIDNFQGNLLIRQQLDDGDIVFQSDDGSGGVTEYFRLDGGEAITVASKDIRMIDDKALGMGSDGDSFIKHTGSQFSFFNDTGHAIFYNRANDKNFEFHTDNGSGGTTSYLTLDGTNVQVSILTQKVTMPNLPTSDPSNAGQLWNDSGTLKISAG